MKKYLIDTHILLWLVSEPEKLSTITQQIISNLDNSIFISLISFWEIAIKTSIGKLEFRTSIKELELLVFQKDISILPLTSIAISKVQNLPFYKINKIEHRDPFDRMLISQAVTENIPIISADTKFDLYADVNRIW